MTLGPAFRINDTNSGTMIAISAGEDGNNNATTVGQAKSLPLDALRNRPFRWTSQKRFRFQ